MMKITSGSAAVCRICGHSIEKDSLRLRCLVAGTHSESCCVRCMRDACKEETTSQAGEWRHSAALAYSFRDVNRTGREKHEPWMVEQAREILIAMGKVCPAARHGPNPDGFGSGFAERHIKGLRRFRATSI